MPKRNPTPRTYHIEPVPQPPPQSSWLSAIGGIPIAIVIAFVFSGAVFYGVSQYKDQDHDNRLGGLERKYESLADHAKRLSDLERKHESSAPVVAAQLEKERAERERVREAFIANSNETTKLLGQMNARLAVTETTQRSQTDTLKQIYEELRSLNSGKKR